VHFTIIWAELKSFRPAYLDGLKLCVYFNRRPEAAHTGALEQCPLVRQHFLLLWVKCPHIKAYGPRAPHVQDISRRFENVVGTVDVVTCKAWESVYDFKAASSTT
jgi:hypothetical protein